MLHTTNGPLTVFSTDELNAWFDAGAPADNPPQPILGAGEDDGSADFLLKIQGTLPAPHTEIPFIFDVFDSLSLIQQTGLGTGTFTAHAADFGFTPGARGKVLFNLINSANVNVEKVTLEEVGPGK